MIALARALHAEQLKLRGTLAVWLCVLMPTVVAVLGIAMIWSIPAMLPKGTPQSHWTAVIQSLSGTWAGMMLPLFVTLQAALSAGLEHGNQQWKHLLALPVPRSAHYLAKLLSLIALLALATGVLCVLVVLGGLLLTTTSEPVLVGLPPWTFLIGHALASVAAALLLIAVMAFVAIRWRSFNMTMTCGISATMIALFVPKGGWFGELFPWAMPITAVSARQGETWTVLALSVLGFCVVAALGMWDFSRREHA